MLFGAMSGSPPATVAATGAMAIPLLTKQGSRRVAMLYPLPVEGLKLGRHHCQTTRRCNSR
ncbi:TRAP transporter large permease subunit [Martelella sp. FOR1707]